MPRPTIVHAGAPDADEKLGPDPVIIDLSDEYGYAKRIEATEWVESHRAKGKESGSPEEQITGRIAQTTVLDLVPGARDAGDELGYDFALRSGLKVDVKCRGGVFPFDRSYERRGGAKCREAKHNHFARQLMDPNRPYEADICVFCHLTCAKPAKKTTSLYPGTRLQRKWKLYVCGWVSAGRLKRGVFLPAGAITEQGSKWFAYRANEVEFYHKNLRPLFIAPSGGLAPLELLGSEDIRKDDEESPPDLHLTSTDFARIYADRKAMGAIQVVPDPVFEGWEPILHPNQYWHVAVYLARNKVPVNLDVLQQRLGNPVSYQADLPKARALPPE